MLTARALTGSRIESRLEDWSLADHVRTLLRAWPILLLAPMVFGALAFVVSERGPAEARAVGLVRIANVQGYGYVEPPAEVVARISSPGFLNAVLSSRSMQAGSKVWLTASSVGKTGLITLEAHAGDEISAASILRAAAERLAADHTPTVDHLKRVTMRRLEEIDDFNARADAELSKSVINPSDIPQYVTRMRLLEERSKLQKDAMDLRLKTDPDAFPSTSLLDTPYTETMRQPSQKHAILAAFAGLAAAIIAAYVMRQASGSRAARETAASPTPRTAETAGRAD